MLKNNKISIEVEFMGSSRYTSKLMVDGYFTNLTRSGSTISEAIHSLLNLMDEYNINSIESAYDMMFKFVRKDEAGEQSTSVC